MVINLNCFEVKVILAKILKSEKELKALDNTLNHLRNRNSNYRDNFLNKGVSAQQKGELEGLEE